MLQETIIWVFNPCQGIAGRDGQAQGLVQSQVPLGLYHTWEVYISETHELNAKCLLACWKLVIVKFGKIITALCEFWIGDISIVLFLWYNSWLRVTRNTGIHQNNSENTEVYLNWIKYHIKQFNQRSKFIIIHIAHDKLKKLISLLKKCVRV